MVHSNLLHMFYSRIYHILCYLFHNQISEHKVKRIKPLKNKGSSVVCLNKKPTLGINPGIGRVGTLQKLYHIGKDAKDDTIILTCGLVW
jgi:ribosome biogenesis protein Nip4